MTIVDCQGLGRGFNFDSVEPNSSILDGFTITNGAKDTGGGIRISYASPTITNCSIVDNTADYGGGGISVSNSSPDINNCAIEGNRSNSVGGGMYLSTYGGLTGGPRISNCTFTANSADGNGGGLYYSNVRVEYMYTFIWGCRFAGNISGSNGGGICLNNSKVSVYNCLFDSNEAYGGGGIMSTYSEIVIHNCTLVYNDSGNGAGIRSFESNMTIYNGIVYWNIGNPISYSPYAPAVTYSNVQYTVWPGTGNISTDPLFAEEIDFHLSSNSPCVDTGDPVILDGSQPPGLGSTRSDMGAYGGEGNG